jgi:hypothetical protein
MKNSELALRLRRSMGFQMDIFKGNRKDSHRFADKHVCHSAFGASAAEQLARTLLACRRKKV